MRLVRGISVIVLASAAVRGQTLPAESEFEVASIRPSGPPVIGQVNIGVHVDGAQVRCTSFSLNDYIGMAYKVRNYQISGPEWLTSDRYDINAKLPEGATREQVPEMLQTLLAKRFQVKMHRDNKPYPVYGLIVAKGGAKLKEIPQDEADNKGDVDVKVAGGRGGVSLNLGKGSSFTFADNRLEAKKLSMTGLADLLARFMDRPVVDMTELKGNYDIALDLAPEDFLRVMFKTQLHLLRREPYVHYQTFVCPVSVDFVELPQHVRRECSEHRMLHD